MSGARFVLIAAATFSFVIPSVGSAADQPPIKSRIHREPVVSSAIASAGYSKRRHILEIEFCNGALYRYLDVPASVYREMMAAASKAKFYDVAIKGNYESVRLRAAEPSSKATGAAEAQAQLLPEVVR